MRNPIVSIIITNYNYSNYIAQSIDSALSQSYSRTEVIVIDDGSTDNSREICMRYGETIRYYFQKNKGLPKALNVALEKAKGEMICFLDADDYLKPNMIQTLIEVMRKSSDSFISFGAFQSFYSEDLLKSERKKYVLNHSRGGAKTKLTMLAKIEVFDKVGGFDENHNHSDFIEWFMRVEKRGIKYVMIDEVVSYRRIHGKNMTLANKESWREQVLKLARMKLNE